MKSAFVFSSRRSKSTSRRFRATLAYLRRAGIVEARREGLWMHYRIVETENDDVNKIVRDTLELVAKDPEMQADRERMIHVCCAPEPPAGVLGAPVPASLVNYQCNTKC